MAFSTINKSSDYMNTVLYTGNYTDDHAITGVGFQPDLVWIKDRDDTSAHQITDAVRGATKTLYPNTNALETTDTNYVKSFDSDGFTVGVNNANNQNNANNVAWNWKANGAGSANTDGDITSTVSANSTAGFSIVKYTGDGSSVTTVGHGCSSEPKFVILKNISSSSDWVTYHYGAGATGLNNTNQASLLLNGTNASANPASGGYLQNGYFSNVNSTTITLRDVNSATNVNTSGDDYIAYCFAENNSKMFKAGSYTGNNNADGVFCYTEQKSSFIMAKRTDSAGDWYMFDNKMTPSNVAGIYHNANKAEADHTTAAYHIDILSNGFKLRGTGTELNASGGTYIYMAFGQPIISNSGICATAR